MHTCSLQTGLCRFQNTPFLEKMSDLWSPRLNGGRDERETEPETQTDRNPSDEVRSDLFLVSCVPLSTCLCLFGFYCLNAFVICCTNWSFTQIRVQVALLFGRMIASCLPSIQLLLLLLPAPPLPQKSDTLSCQFHPLSPKPLLLRHQLTNHVKN